MPSCRDPGSNCRFQLSPVVVTCPFHTGPCAWIGNKATLTCTRGRRRGSRKRPRQPEGPVRALAAKPDLKTTTIPSLYHLTLAADNEALLSSNS